MRPAAYIRIVSRPGAQPPARQREAIIAVARDRGWPEPVVYADDGRATANGYGPALAKLSAAVGAGRHDMVIMPGPGVISRSPAHLMAFLFRCNHHGVAVEFLSPAAAADAFLMRPPPAPQRPPRPPYLPSAAPPPSAAGLPSAASLLAAAGLSPAASLPGARSTPSPGRKPPPPPRCAAGTADVLTSAGIEALTRAFPDWRIWADDYGWHARRRGSVYVQAYQHGAPAFCVHGVSAIDLAAQLRWQQAADVHSPVGCSRR
jgi:Resolvase, N terminal domain